MWTEFSFDWSKLRLTHSVELLQKHWESVLLTQRIKRSNQQFGLHTVSFDLHTEPQVVSMCTNFYFYMAFPMIQWIYTFTFIIIISFIPNIKCSLCIWRSLQWQINEIYDMIYDRRRAFTLLEWTRWSKLCDHRMVLRILSYWFAGKSLLSQSPVHQHRENIFDHMCANKTD